MRGLTHYDTAISYSTPISPKRYKVNDRFLIQLIMTMESLPKVYEEGDAERDGGRAAMISYK